MQRLTFRRASTVLLAGGLFLAACSETQTDVEQTIPRPNEEGVHPRSIIAIELSNSFTSKDDKVTDPANISVTGNLSSSPYAGTLVLTRSNKIRRGQTIEDFQKSGAGAAPAPTPAPDTKDSKDPAPKPKPNDTIVFLLADNTRFKSGETVLVVVRDDVTSHGVPIRSSRRFTFRVRDDDGDDSLKVASTDPRPADVAASLRPRISAAFNRAVKSADLGKTIVVRGSHSGAHSDGEVLLTKTEGSGGALEISWRLAMGDSFLPGEFVDAAFPSTITGVSTAAGAATKLAPHLLRFQVRPAKLASGEAGEPWDEDVSLPVVESPVRSVAADFRPLSDGVEVLTLGSDSVGLHFQLESRAWTMIEAPLDLAAGTETLRPVDAVASDVDSDGAPEAAILLTGGSKSRMEIYGVDDAGDLVRAMEPIDIPASQAHGLAAADLDGNGKAELIVTHPSSTYTPSSGGSRRTGNLSILELRLVPPTADEIAKDPTNLEPRPRFELIEDPIQGFGEATRMDVVDVHGDGRLDLLSEVDGTLVLHRNLGGADTVYAFLLVGKAPGREGSPLRPLAWAAADVDDDGSMDLVAWDDIGGMVHRNLSGGFFPSPEPFEGVGPETAEGALTTAADLDGDGATDVAIADADGTIHVLRGGPDFPSEGSIELPGTSLPPATFTAADMDGDTGLDLVALDATAGTLEVRLSNVLDPASAADSRFRFGEAAAGDDDTIRVPVLADIAERFRGYSIAIDYDEKLLTYRGFDSPPDFQSNASFTRCPDEDLQGCPGNISAKMSYLQGTVGGEVEGLLLGTLVFSKKEVTAVQTTSIEFKSFTGSGNAKFDNTLSVVDGSADLPVAVGDPLSIEVTEPVLPDLEAVCTVLRRNPEDNDRTTRVRVAWSSPSGRTFPSNEYVYEVSVQGESPITFSNGETSHEFTTERVGTIGITVRAVATSPGRPVAASAECEVIGIHRPSVDCFVVSDTENRITWSLDHSVTGFAVYRNGVHIHQAAPGDREYNDRSPSGQGGDIYEVAGLLFSTEGPRGSCGPVGDSDPGTTLPPRIVEAAPLSRMAPSDPNRLRFRWVNGEGYESIEATLTRSGEASPLKYELDRGATEFLYDGDNEPGGAKPGQYVFTVTGTASGSTGEARSGTVNVRVPPLGANFTCVLDGGGSAKLSWDAPWKGYDSLKLRIEHTQDGNPLDPVIEIPLALSATEHTQSSVSPVGTYTFTLIAEYGAALPSPVRPSAEDLQRTCQLEFSPRIRTGTVETGVGLRDFELPIQANVFGSVTGFHFEIEYPSFLVIDSGSGLRVDHAGARIEEFRLGPGSPGTGKATVTVSGIQTPVDADGDGKADGRTILCVLLASVPPDFSLVGERDLRIVGDATLSFQGTGSIPVSTSSNGKLRVWGRYVVLDRAVMPAGSSTAIKLSVRATFDAPESAPNYRLNAFTIHLKWDPDLLEPLPITQEDQRDTVVFRKGSYFLPNDAALATARVTGELKTSWLGFDFADPSKAFFVTPGIDQSLFAAKFRSRIPGDRPATFIPVQFVSAPGSDNPTAFFPEVDVPSEPDLEGFIDGGVRVTSSGGAFAVQSIQPSRGSLLGGNEAVITGSGFPAGGSAPAGLSIRFQPSAGGTVKEVPSGDLISVESTRIRFRVPDSGVREGSSSRPHNVSVRVGDLTATLDRGYTYDPLKLDGADRTSGAAAGGEPMLIRGAGFAPLPSTSVAFRVPGVAQPFPAEVSSVQPDGTRILLLTPDLRGHETKRATVEVTVAGLPTLALPTTYEILTGGGGTTLEVTGISPARGTICGGLEVTVTGRGFLPGITVRFGNETASSATFVDGQTIRVMTPAVPEGTEAVDLVVANTTGDPVIRSDGFRYEPAAPAFLRGDVSNDGNITITDVVVLTDIILGRERSLPPNIDAADANDDGVVNTGDVTAIMNTLFGGESPLPQPYPPSLPGFDGTPDALTSCPIL